jgi:hypothetical protein
MPLLLPAPIGAASIQKAQKPDIAGPTGLSEEKYHLVKSPEAMTGQLPRETPKKGERYNERSVVISLQRTICPFCGQDIAKFGNCVYCGQHFVWANVRLCEKSSPGPAGWLKASA